MTRQKILAYVEELGVQRSLTELEFYGGKAGTGTGCWRGPSDPLNQSRPGIDLAGETLNLQSIEIAIAVYPNDLIAVEPQILGTHEVALSFHSNGHNDQ